jgi:polysaccharide pyruvyl transferase WcaK-like protein
VLLGVGVEREALRRAARFRRILERVDVITARDHMSSTILTQDLGVAPARVRTGGDLANVFLEAVSPAEPERSRRPVKVAVNFYRERFDLRSRLALAQLFRRRPRDEFWCFLLSETRLFLHSELALYNAHHRLWDFANRPGRVPMITANYLSPHVADLVSHLASIETVLATRYHLLLAAAWYGCRVCGIARSSKIAALCEELEIPMVDDPLTPRTLQQGIAVARRVDRERLTDIAARGRAVHVAAISRLLADTPV